MRNRRFISLTVRLLLVGAIVGLGVRYARGIDLQAIRNAVAGANPWLLLLSALGNGPLVWTKARRMRTLLSPDLAADPTSRTRISSLRLMALYVTSYAADNLVMSQAGLGLRVAFFRLNGVPLATAASAQAIEKALEAIGLGLVAGPFLWLPGKLGWLRGPVLWVTAAAVFGLVLMLVLLPRIGNRVVQNLAHGAAALRRPRFALELIGLTLLGWVIEALMVIAVLAGMHLDAHLFSAAALVLLAVNMAALVPGLPANVGTFEVSCTLALGAVGVPAAPALSFALVYHALHTVPVTVVGLATQRWVRGRNATRNGGGSSEAPEAPAPETSGSTTSGS